MADDALAFMNLMLLIGAMTTKRLEQAAHGAGETRNEQLHKAREYIDMMASLKKRTTGRLTEDEARIMETLLTDLQTRYVKTLVLRPPGEGRGAAGR